MDPHALCNTNVLDYSSFISLIPAWQLPIQCSLKNPTWQFEIVFPWCMVALLYQIQFNLEELIFCCDCLFITVIFATIIYSTQWLLANYNRQRNIQFLFHSNMELIGLFETHRWKFNATQQDLSKIHVEIAQIHNEVVIVGQGILHAV